MKKLAEFEISQELTTQITGGSGGSGAVILVPNPLL